MAEENDQLKYTKANFLLLCKQYEAMGQFVADLAQETGTEAKTAPYIALVLEQYMEMGGQLKAVGAGLDDLGGPSVMRPPPIKRNCHDN